MGCTHCIQRCPTEAIRVRDGKAVIIKERCIDCGECIRICPHHAKKPIFDPLSVIENYEYAIALPAPSLYAQFNNLDDVDIVLNGLRRIGFDDVYEVAAAAELVSDGTRKLMKAGKLPRPVISSACPAVVRLIRVRFPELISHLLPIHAPVELAARIAKKQAAAKTGLPVEKIGAIFISPCPAKVTAVREPLGTEKSAVDAVVAIREVYAPLAAAMKAIRQPEEMTTAGRVGIGWASSGGEAAGTLNEQYLAADGIEHVIQVLEDLEDEKLPDLDFVELNACAGGCVGGVLTVENPYIAKTKLLRLRRYCQISKNRIRNSVPREALFDQPIEYEPVLQLDDDIEKSMEMLHQIQEVESRLYGMDCGSCGAPSCRAMAEDIVKGFATEDMCIHIMKEKLQKVTRQMEDYIEKQKEGPAFQQERVPGSGNG